MLTILAQTSETTDTASAGGSAVMLIVWAVVIGGLFWFMLIRPQRTRAKRQQVLQSALEVDTEVHTIGGIIGRIEFMDDEIAVLQLEGGGRMRVLRKAIAGKFQPPASE
jgi:preprotein translocase subunit YajC